MVSAINTRNRRWSHRWGLMMLIFVWSLAFVKTSFAPTKTRDITDESEVGIDGSFSRNSISFDDINEEDDGFDDDDDELDEKEEDVFEPDNVQRAVDVHNHYSDRWITIYWQGSNGDTVKMDSVGPSAAMTLNTYNGHEFYPAEEDDSDSRLMEYNFVIKGNQKTYHIRPSDADYLKTRPAQSSAKKQKKVKVNRPKGSVHPALTFLNQPTTSMNAKFRSFVPEPIHIWYDDKRGGLYQGLLTLGKEYTINSYEGHVFFFTNAEDKSIEYARHTMNKDIVTYPIFHPTLAAPAELLDKHQKESLFMEDYYNRTGIRWRHFFGPDGPRGPPELFMWPAQKIGQRHLVESTEGHWSCKGESKDCQAQSGAQLELEVVSQQPRVFIIENFLSDFEADEIIRLARPLEASSQVGNNDAGGARKSDTRTSKNAWIGRKTNEVTEAMSRRAADVLQIDEALLGPKNAEDLQVVHYHIGQKYDSHHDWGVSGFRESRYITILFYLTDMENPGAGGETAFPKGANGTGFKVHPGRGGAVLFYNLLEDGNGDDLALHAALPVKTGEKWLANYWVWDPKRK